MEEEGSDKICEYERKAMVQRAKVRASLAELEAELKQGFASL